MIKLPTRKEINSLTKGMNLLVPPTPQYSWPLINQRAGREVWVKHENHTEIGSFKIRGAFAYLLRRLADTDVRRGVVAATRGNFGQAVAFAGRHLNIPVTILVPRGNSPEKNRAMIALGAELIEHGEDFQAALVYSKKLAEERARHWIPAFHVDLALGNAISMMNFLSQIPSLSAVYIPIGMGSGLCALAAAKQALKHSTAIVGVAVAAAPAISLSYEARKVVPHSASTRIADGMATSTPNPDALELILEHAEKIVAVTDDEVEAAMRAYFTDTHNVAEGAAGAALAGLLKDAPTRPPGPVGVVLSGGNVDAATFARVLAG